MKLIAKNINKEIKGHNILTDINLSLESGTVYGFVGRNGSGKTMLFRALSGLMRVNSGEVIMNDKVLHKDISTLPSLGITLEKAGLYPEFTGMKNLKLLAKIHGKIDEREIANAIARVGLDPTDKRPFHKYSLGMKQRIVLAQAIMERPDILMLDEPTNSLDVDGVELIRQVILEEKRRGAMILLASHNQEDMNLLADKIFHIVAGKLTEAGELHE